MKQIRLLTVVSIFSLLAIACLGLSMLAYKQSYSVYQNTLLPPQQSAQMTPKQKRQYLAELNAIYLRNQFM